MDTIFLNSKKSKIYDLQRLLFNLSDKVNLKRSDNMLLYMEKYKQFIQK